MEKYLYFGCSHCPHEINGILIHALVPVKQAFYGLCIGVGLAFVMATLMDHFQILNKALYPILIITQTIPTIAIAPLLVLWMGFYMAPKITLVVITTFFPITVGLLDGYKSVDKDSCNVTLACFNIVGKSVTNAFITCTGEGSMYAGTAPLWHKNCQSRIRRHNATTAGSLLVMLCNLFVNGQHVSFRLVRNLNISVHCFASCFCCH